jgi:hypothetical protein
MVNALIMLGVIALVGYIVLFVDWLSRRKERRSRHRSA